jgi:transcriptional regulator with XRE-family HTH domain
VDENYKEAKMDTLVKDKDEAISLLIERLNSLKEAKGYSNRKISQVTGISPAHIDGIMRGRNFPSLEKIIRIVISLEGDLNQTLKGLESFIKPKGFKIQSWDNQTHKSYYKEVSIILTKIKQADNFELEDYKAEYFKLLIKTKDLEMENTHLKELMKKIKNITKET